MRLYSFEIVVEQEPCNEGYAARGHRILQNERLVHVEERRIGVP
jgi:hypothetical protein